jgi:hypothetical protein
MSAASCLQEPSKGLAEAVPKNQLGRDPAYNSPRAETSSVARLFRSELAILLRNEIGILYGKFDGKARHSWDYGTWRLHSQ